MVIALLRDLHRRMEAEVFSHNGTTAPVPRDRRDDIVPATCIAGRADYLLTGDADLLALRSDHAILTAREFYEPQVFPDSSGRPA